MVGWWDEIALILDTNRPLIHHKRMYSLINLLNNYYAKLGNSSNALQNQRNKEVKNYFGATGNYRFI